MVPPALQMGVCGCRGSSDLPQAQGCWVAERRSVWTQPKCSLVFPVPSPQNTEHLAPTVCRHCAYCVQALFCALYSLTHSVLTNTGAAPSAPLYSREAEAPSGRGRGTSLIFPLHLAAPSS